MLDKYASLVPLMRPSAPSLSPLDNRWFHASQASTREYDITDHHLIFLWCKSHVNFMIGKAKHPYTCYILVNGSSSRELLNLRTRMMSKAACSLLPSSSSRAMLAHNQSGISFHVRFKNGDKTAQTANTATSFDRLASICFCFIYLWVP